MWRFATFHCFILLNITEDGIFRVLVEKKQEIWRHLNGFWEILTFYNNRSTKIDGLIIYVTEFLFKILNMTKGIKNLFKFPFINFNTLLKCFVSRCHYTACWYRVQYECCIRVSTGMYLNQFVFSSALISSSLCVSYVELLSLSADNENHHKLQTWSLPPVQRWQRTVHANYLHVQ